MLLLEPTTLGNDLRRSALRLVEEVADRGRDVADRGRNAFYRVTSRRPDPIDELRVVATFAVGAAAVIGAAYLISRVIRSRREANGRAGRSDRGYGRDRRSGRADDAGGREEPTRELLARLDSPEAIEEHNERVRQKYEEERPSSGRAPERANYA